MEVNRGSRQGERGWRTGDCELSYEVAMCELIMHSVVCIAPRRDGRDKRAWHYVKPRLIA